MTILKVIFWIGLSLAFSLVCVLWWMMYQDNKRDNAINYDGE